MFEDKKKSWTSAKTVCKTIRIQLFVGMNGRW